MGPYAISHSLPRVKIGHAMVNACAFDDAVKAIIGAAVTGDETEYVVTPNVQHIALLAKDKYFRRIYSDAAFVLPDGISLLLAARLLGERIPERIAGVDMFQALCRAAAREGLRVFLLGGRPGSAEKASTRLRSQCPGLIVSGICCPPLGFDENPREEADVESHIRAAHPHLLFVALGAPKQEYWIYEHSRQLNVPIAVGVGGSFEMVGGIIPRAPQWVQRSGFEWLYRLLREPRRLWKRYLVAMIEFAQVVMRQRLSVERATHT